MAWSYRKRIKIAPGVHINLSKNGMSASVGIRGASVTMGSKGTYLNTGIPGTGLYSRKKISGSPTTHPNNAPHLIVNNSENNIEIKHRGCRIFCGIILLLIMIGGIINLYTKTFNYIAKDEVCVVLWILIGIIVIIIFSPWLKHRNVIIPDSSVSNDPLDSKPNLSVERYGYDYVILRYNQEEQEAIKKSDLEINQAKSLLETTTDPNKKIILQSIIDCTKYDRLKRLYSRYHKKTDNINDELDFLFERIARKIISTQKFDFTYISNWFDYNLDIDRELLIEQQLEECGIIEHDFEKDDTRVLIKDSKSLDKIIKKANGKTLLSLEEKIKINKYLDAREDELIGNHALKIYLNGLSENVIESYQNFHKAYESLVRCKGVWEIVSIEDNPESKSFAKTVVNRNRLFTQYSCNYKFLQPLENSQAAYFNFRNAGIDIYIYPEFVVVSRNDNFDIIPLNQFELEFCKNNFVETSTFLLPQDAKLTKYTYKHINLNGERDARYSDNPRYGIYEYGDIMFKPLNLTMMFSNSDMAEQFVRSFQMLKKGMTTYVEPLFGANEKYFNNSKDVAKVLTSYYNTLGTNRSVLRIVDNTLSDEHGTAKEKLRCLFLSDVIKCYEQLGHDSINLYTKEGLPLVLLECLIITNTEVTFNTTYLPQLRNLVEKFCCMNKSYREIFIKDKAEDFFFINEVLKSSNQDELVISFFSLLYRFFSVVAKADGTITDDESAWLKKLMSYSLRKVNCSLDKFEEIVGLKYNQDNGSKHLKNYDSGPVEEKDPIMKLHSLIGLDEVKKEVTALANFVKIQKEREKNGLKTVGLSYHCVFTGNPGTGKTTVARIVAEIYKSLGLLKQGHLVETDRSGLVAEYVGQTAVKTNKIIDSALDGVLFIDEAYSLVQGGSNDYGNEAISTLLKRMEDDRNRLIIILAGYGEEMKQFIDSNPGLQSRFNRYIHFADYNVEDLKKIFMYNAINNQYKITPEASEILTETLTYAVEHKDKNFGNGRFVRNIFEKSLQNQAVRLSCQPQTSVEELSLLTINDIPTINN